MEEGGGSGRNFLNGHSQKLPFLPPYAKGTCAPFRGNLPNELISRQSSFSWRGAQSAAAKSPNIGNRLLQTCRLSGWPGRCLAGSSSEGCSRCILLQPSAASQPGRRHGAVPGVRGWHGTGHRSTWRAGLAWHGWHPACRVGMARHRDTQCARLAQHSTAQRGTSTQAGMAQHRTGQRGTSMRDWHGTAWSRGSIQGCTAHPAAPGPAQGHSWPPLGLSSSSQRHGCPPLGTSSFPCIHPPHPHPSQRHM